MWDNKVEFKLGRTESEAFTAYAKRIAISEDCETMRDVLTRYRLEILPTKANSTQKQRAYSLPRLMTAFGDLIPFELTPSMIYKYMDHVKRVKSEKVGKYRFGMPVPRTIKRRQMGHYRPQSSYWPGS